MDIKMSRDYNIFCLFMNESTEGTLIYLQRGWFSRGKWERHKFPRRQLKWEASTELQSHEGQDGNGQARKGQAEIPFETMRNLKDIYCVSVTKNQLYKPSISLQEVSIPLNYLLLEEKEHRGISKELGQTFGSDEYVYQLTMMMASLLLTYV